MKRSLNSVVAAVAALGLFAMVGCSDGTTGGRRVPVHKVTGKVTLFGAPLPGAVVSFAPKAGQPFAMGRTNDAGEFTMTTYDLGDGAAAGLFGVVISKYAPPADNNQAAASSHSTDVNAKVSSSHNAKDADAATVGLVPPQYSDSTTTPLTMTVEEKDNTVTFELK